MKHTGCLTLGWIKILIYIINSNGNIEQIFCHYNIECAENGNYSCTENNEVDALLSAM